MVNEQYYKIVCHQCAQDAMMETEEAAVGWMFGHNIRTGHENIERFEI